MIRKKHFTIPFFIAHEGCPHKCVFCNQNEIIGQNNIAPIMVKKTIEEYLTTINFKESHVEVGFFGGSFSGLPQKVQESYLNPVQEYIDRGIIQGIRISTRPDFINAPKLTFLKSKNVICIELGVQSITDSVLEVSKRGHTADQTVKATRMIKEGGFSLGYQMMIGMPGSKWEDEVSTAIYAKDLGAKEVRIYPMVVIMGTELEKMWENGKYVEMSDEEAISRCAKLISFFEVNGIKVIKCGLHPSENLLAKKDFLAGPFHESFRFKVESYIFNKMLKRICDCNKNEMGEIVVRINPKDEASFLGYRNANSNIIEKIGRREKEDNILRGNIDFVIKGQKKQMTREVLLEGDNLFAIPSK